MIIVFGRRVYGRVEGSGPTFVYTEFAHLWYLPIIPCGSYLALGRDAKGALRVIPIGFHPMSVLAGYLRIWAVVGAVACAIAAATAGGGLVDGLPWAVVAAGLAAVAVVAWVRLGKLSAAEVARRQAYGRFAGVPVDVAQLGPHREALVRSLREAVAAQGKGLMSGTYRYALDPAAQWSEIALDPTVLDRPYLEACLTLSRVEWSLATGPERERIHAIHRKLSRRLASLPPASLPT